jgi:hypothetical protein
MSHSNSKESPAFRRGESSKEQNGPTLSLNWASAAQGELCY